MKKTYVHIVKCWYFWLTRLYIVKKDRSILWLTLESINLDPFSAITTHTQECTHTQTWDMSIQRPYMLLGPLIVLHWRGFYTPWKEKRWQNIVMLTQYGLTVNSAGVVLIYKGCDGKWYYTCKVVLHYIKWKTILLNTDLSKSSKWGNGCMHREAHAVFGGVNL